MSSALACANRSMRCFSSIARSLPSSSTQLRHPKRAWCLGSASSYPYGHHGAGSLAARPAMIMMMTVRAQTNSAPSPRPATSSSAQSANAQSTTPYSRNSPPNPPRPISSPPSPPPPPSPSSSSSSSPAAQGGAYAARSAESYYATQNEKSHAFADGLNDAPVTLDTSGSRVDWTRSFHGLSEQPFSKEAAEVLQQPIPPEDIEVKPDGIMYLPEIKYRRILNKAFGPGGWGLAPRGETIITDKSVTREYALVAHGRLVSVARGEQDYFSMDNIPTAVEGCKSNAMMRCCKDLGVASELWDPRFCRNFMAQHAKEVFVENQLTRKRRKIWMRKDDTVRYPFKTI